MIKFYTTHCPKCHVLELKLKQKSLDYEEFDTVEEMLAKGLTSAPYLEIDDKLLNFSEAVKYVNSL